MNQSDVPAVAAPEVVEAFTSAAITTFQELVQIDTFALQVPHAPDVGLDESVVSANLRLVRDAPGTMFLVLAAATASRLAARYLPEGTTLNEEMIDDVAGEFANVIAGQAKTILKGTLYHFTMSTPVVARAASFARLPGVAKGKIAAALESEIGQVWVLVDLTPCPSA